MSSQPPNRHLLWFAQSGALRQYLDERAYGKVPTGKILHVTDEGGYSYFVYRPKKSNDPLTSDEQIRSALSRKHHRLVSWVPLAGFNGWLAQTIRNESYAVRFNFR